MTVLVTGVRGNIGSRVAALLAESGCDVRGSTRDLSEAASPPGIETVELDLTDPRDAAKALAGAETVFLYPVRGSIAGFLDAVVASDVQHVVLLSSPAAYEAGEHDRAIGLAHRAVEEELQRSGVTHTVLYPSWLATNARRDWGEQIRTRRRVSMAYPQAQVNPIHIDDVAEVAVDLLTSPAHRGRMVMITGPESVPQGELVGVLGEVLGAPIAVDELTREQALVQRAAWMPEPVLEVLLDVAAAAVDVPAAITNSVERITGHSSRAFREWVVSHRGDFG